MSLWQWIQTHVLETVYGFVVSGVATLVATWIHRQKALRAGVLALLHDSIVRTCRYHKSVGYIPVPERESLVRMADAYQKQGGNGVIPGLVGQVLALPEANPNVPAPTV